MKYIISLFISSILISKAQEPSLPKFQLTREGIEPIVLIMDSITAPELYKRTIYWVQKTYQNPDKAMVANIPNEEIRVEGYKKTAWIHKGFGMVIPYDLAYTFKIQFKDMKIRLNYIPNEVFAGGKMGKFESSSWFKNDGSIANSCKGYKSGLEDSMNELVNSLYNSLKEGKKDDW